MARFDQHAQLLIHGYDVIDLDIVWDTVTADLPQMKAIVQALLAEGD